MTGWIATFLLSDPAAAQQACIQPMSRIQLGAAIGDVSDALEASELVDARTHLTGIAERLPCLDEVVDPNLLALFARYNATVYYYGQDEDQALRWGLLSRLADPALAWDDQLYPEDHPVRKMIDGADLPASGVMRDKGLVPPKGGGIFVNGVFAPRPEAHYEVPSLVQVFDRGRSKVDAFWIEGPSFPSGWTVMKVADVAPPSWWDGKSAGPPPSSPKPAPNADPVAAVPTPPPVAPKRTVRPPRPVNPNPQPVPVVPVVVSIVLAGVSGGTYLLADSIASTLPDQQTPDDLTAVRSRANLLVMASGVSLAGAVGVGVGGILVSSGGVTVRF
jgi:hypothetical protein